MPLEDGFNLRFTDKTFTNRVIIKYRKTQSNPPTPNIPGWQFVNDNKTLILTSAERRDSGTYNLSTIDANGTDKGVYSLQLNIEAQVSSVKVSYSCLSPGVIKVFCSADGDNLHFNWTSDFNTVSQLENRNSTLILNNVHHRNVTCSVENHISRDHITTEVYSCPESTTVSGTTTAHHGTNSTVSHIMTHNPTTSAQSPSNISLLLYLILISLSSVFVLLIMISILAFLALYIYKKRQGQKNKEAHDEDVEYAEVVTRATKRKQKKKEDEVQYGELVFNTPARSKHKVAKVQDDCVYSHVQHNQ
ncbi:uncharacterized protein LOC128544406 isoform X3 [Clarias gariepinus]|uniref:uncharacterized protein LOC128544406 isoform X3 n=1 Tax=Clarias gariepinus TaxID=13013 RepID=UPI00234CDEFF|nr:uncharacterized protein LOC128544406 isoform X3 [Clarias gariepinus]